VFFRMRGLVCPRMVHRLVVQGGGMFINLANSATMERLAFANNYADDCGGAAFIMYSNDLVVNQTQCTNNTSNFQFSVWGMLMRTTSFFCLVFFVAVAYAPPFLLLYASLFVSSGDPAYNTPSPPLS